MGFQRIQNAEAKAVFQTKILTFLYDIFTCAGIASLLGNGLAVHVFQRKGSEINVPEVLLLNIAVVDLFLGIASYPATIVSAFSHRWVLGQTGIVSVFHIYYYLLPKYGI